MLILLSMLIIAVLIAMPILTIRRDSRVWNKGVCPKCSTRWKYVPLNEEEYLGYCYRCSSGHGIDQMTYRGQ